MTVLLRSYGKSTALSLNVNNVSVSAEQDGVVIEPTKLEECIKNLKKEGYSFVQEGITVRVSCKSIFCF